MGVSQSKKCKSLVIIIHENTDGTKEVKIFSENVLCNQFTAQELRVENT
jgi:hypothetical protein